MLLEPPPQTDIPAGAKAQIGARHDEFGATNERRKRGLGFRRRTVVDDDDRGGRRLVRKASTVGRPHRVDHGE